MDTITIKLTQIKTNKENPRTITTDKFNKLVDSILTFPKMLELRPIVIDKTYKALGGNMRTQALQFISKMSINDIKLRLSRSKDYNKRTEAEQTKLCKMWEEWIADPTAFVVRADKLTKEEQEQFVIKDNVAFGAWDFDALANKFDNATLGDWGMDIWQMPEASPMGVQGMQSAPGVAPNYPSAPAASEDDGSGYAPEQTFNLPEELQGSDLTPAELPKLEGTDETVMERVIIVFPKDRADEVAALLGIEKVEKIIYRIDELNGDLAAE